MPSLLLSTNIAGWHTSKQENTINQETPYILHIMHSKKGTRAGCPFSSHTNGLVQLEECRTLIEEVLQYLATSIWHQGAR